MKGNKFGAILRYHEHVLKLDACSWYITFKHMVEEEENNEIDNEIDEKFLLKKITLMKNFNCKKLLFDG